MASRSKGKSFRNIFKTKSFRRAMDAVDDAWHAEQAKKRRETEAKEAAVTPQEITQIINNKEKA